MISFKLEDDRLKQITGKQFSLNSFFRVLTVVIHGITNTDSHRHCKVSPTMWTNTDCSVQPNIYGAADVCGNPDVEASV